MFHRHGGDIYACLTDGQPGRAGAYGNYNEIRDFSANINFRGMPASVRQAAEQAVAEAVHYPDPECRALRAALAKRETALLRETNGEYGAEPAQPGAERECGSARDECEQRIQASQIICGNGAAELMFALAAARRPKKALLAIPSFFEYEQALAAFGCELRHFCLREDQDYQLNETFLDAADAGTDCIVLGNPNNPTGRLIEGAVLERLIRKCCEKKILLVLDESFYDFLCEEDRKRTFSSVREVPGHPEVFVMRSFTKMYGMPGLRFGYGICSDAGLLERMHAVLQPWNVSVPAQAAAGQAAGDLEFARETARMNQENRTEMVRWMREVGYQVWSSHANFILFRGPVHLKEFCLDRGFLIRDCSNFPGLEKGFFRICIRSSAENAALMKVLADAKEKLRGAEEKTAHQRDEGV